MNIKYLQKFISCKEKDIEDKMAYASGYSKISKDNVSCTESRKSSSTENAYMDSEDSNKSKCLSVQYASSLEAKRSCVDDNSKDDRSKEILCISTDTSSKSVQSTISECRIRETETRKFETSLGKLCSDDQHREVWAHKILL